MRAAFSGLLTVLVGSFYLTSVALAQPLIVIDAGHGGTDPGAVGCSLEEANVVLDVALRLRTELEGAGLRVALTRDVDEFVGLSARASFANSMGADGFVSVHSNANSGTPASGTETWIANSASARSLELAELLQAQMIVVWGLPDRGVKRADFVVVRDTTMPAALTELAFTNRCDPDAALLGSATERQAMAEAQARAVLEWLGMTPGMTGTLRGVVFEDQGVGTMDLSVRLPGASVRVMETGAMATADAAEAAWSFDLPAGTYTVEASAPGHRTATRTCDVTSAGTTWCSIGLFSDASPPDAAVADASAPSAEDASSAATPDAGELPDADGPPRPSAGGCGCRVPSTGAQGMGTQSTGSSSGGLALLLAFGLIAARQARRSRRAALALLAALVVVTASCAREVEPTAASLEETAAPATPSHDVAHVTRAGAPVRILSERTLLLTDPDGATLRAPIVSPDGARLVATRADLAALFLWSARVPRAVTSLCERARCGHEPRFFIDARTGEARIATRTPEQSASAVPGDAVTLTGEPSAARLGSNGALAWVEGEGEIRVRVDGTTRVLPVRRDRFLRAEISPDHRFVVAWGLTTGLSLHRLADGARFDLGPGGSPHFDPGGRALVFDRTSDDGHAITAGDVYVLALDAEPTLHRVPDADAISLAPSVSRIEGGRATLAMERDGAIVLAEITLE